MSTLFPRTIQAEHRTGSYSRGDWVVSTVENFTFTGSVQPLTGKETEILPENRRDTGLVKIYSNTTLAVSLEGSTTAGDVVIWAGKRWAQIPGRQTGGVRGIVVVGGKDAHRCRSLD